MTNPARSVRGVPSVLVTGATQDSTALPLNGATWMLNAGSAADWLPSLTLIAIFAKVPEVDAEGVPVSAPVAMLKVAHEGMFSMLKVSVEPDGPLAVGVKE